MKLMLFGIASIVACLYLTWLMAYAGSPNAGQTRTDSLIEAWVNIGIGFSVNYVANLLVFPLIDVHIKLGDNFWIGCIFTAVSLVRQLVIRRRMNARMVRSMK
jgi:hypothetical protein